MRSASHPSAVIRIFEACTLQRLIVPLEEIRASQALQLGNFDHAKAVFIPDRGIQALDGDAAAPFDAEAALEVDV